MTTVILRRRKLGKTSTENIARLMENPVTVVLNDRDPMPHNPDMIIRWGCTSQVPNGVPVLNSSNAISYVNDKKRSRLDFARAGYAPTSWESIERVADQEQFFPVIIRPSRHAQGRNLYKCDTPADVRRAIARCGADYYISRYVPKVAEYRVFIAQGRAVWVAQKTPGNPQDIAWNVARGGRFDNVRWGEWPLSVVELAINVFNMTDLDFGGVDVMVDDRGRCYCLEINSAPSQTSPYRQSCVAKVFDYMIEHGKERIPVQDEGKYLRFIHPALDGKAL